MEIRVSIEAVLTLPEGTTVPEEGRAFTLPSGDWVKPFITLELNDTTDLDHAEMVAWEVDLGETNIEWGEK